MKVLTPPGALERTLSTSQDTLISASLSAHTRKAYGHAWNVWLEWLGDREGSDRTASDYLAALHEAGKSPATCALHLAALRSVLGGLANRTLRTA